jgi:hypothetical protein
MNILQLEVGLAAVAGLLSHWGFFLHGECDRWAARIAYFYLAAGVSMFLLQWRVLGAPAPQATYQSFVIDIAYATTLLSSVAVYRLLLSPLRRFPGPVWARLTKLYHFWNTRHADNYKFMDRMHHKYGDIVRTCRPS